MSKILLVAAALCFLAQAVGFGMSPIREWWALGVAFYIAAQAV